MNQTEYNAIGLDSDSRQVIFAVDDEPMVLELVRIIVETLGYRVRAFTNPSTALRAFTLANPAPVLIITDYWMHDMNGMDLIRECRRINRGQKIILVSGTADETIYQNSPDRPTRFLAKPYQVKQLTDLVNEVLDEK